MIPSRKWFPSALQERAAWFNNFTLQMQTVGLTLGFVIGELNALGEDNQRVQFLADSAVALEAYKDAVRQYRIILTEGSIGDPTPAFPADLVLTPSGGTVTTGIWERLDDMVKRARVAPAYTDEIGALLGIIPSKSDPIGEQDLKPVIKASESFGGYSFTLNVTRLGVEAFKVQVSKNGANSWQDVAFATNNPVDVAITPTTPGQPERILVRAILLQKNQPVGQPSDPTFVTVNP